MLLVLEEERSSGADQQQRKRVSPWEAVESRSQANLSEVCTVPLKLSEVYTVHCTLYQANLSKVSQANPALPNCLGMHQPLPQVVLSAGAIGNLNSIFSSHQS